MLFISVICICLHTFVQGKYRILSLDSASYSGYLTSEFISYMEKKAYFIAQRDYCIPERADKRIAMHELFDMIAGSETGAIIAATLVMPNGNMTQAEVDAVQPFSNVTYLNKYWAAKSSNFFIENVDRLYVESQMPNWVQFLISICCLTFTGYISYKIANRCFSDYPRECRLHKLLELLRHKKKLAKGHPTDEKKLKRIRDSLKGEMKREKNMDVYEIQVKIEAAKTNDPSSVEDLTNLQKKLSTLI